MISTKLKLLILNTILLICFSCGGKIPKSPAQEQLKIATIPVEKQLKKQFQLKVSFGDGASTHNKNNQIDTIYESFSHIGVVTIDEARQMLLQSAKLILDAVNTDKEIRPYLVHYPVTIEDLSIGIDVRIKEEKSFHDDTRVPVGDISSFCIVKGVCSYFTRLYITYPVDPGSKLALTETYEEAKAKQR